MPRTSHFIEELAMLVLGLARGVTASQGWARGVGIGGQCSDKMPEDAHVWYNQYRVL